MSSIRLVQVSKHWGDTKALDAIDLAIEPGSFCVLLGPSGCGKSTTLRIIAGLEAASSGQVFVDGIEVTQQPPAQRGIAMVFQNYALFPHLNVADNIGFGLSVRKVEAAESARRLKATAELLGLERCSNASLPNSRARAELHARGHQVNARGPRDAIVLQATQVSSACRGPAIGPCSRYKLLESVMGKYLLGWVLGVPVIVLVLVYLFFR